jgi:hypothetical protein
VARILRAICRQLHDNSRSAKNGAKMRSESCLGDNGAFPRGAFDHGDGLRSLRASAMAIPGSPAAKQRTRAHPAILAHGFARAPCEDWGHERLIPFSCNGRGICPSCNARRICEVAAHLTDAVLPHVPIRQWVLSVPKRLRPYLHRDHARRQRRAPDLAARDSHDAPAHEPRSAA